MKLVPQNSYILCKKIQDSTKEVNANGFSYKVENMPIYQILSIGSKVDKNVFKIGDNVTFQTSGTKVTFDNTDLYLFDSSNFVCCVC